MCIYTIISLHLWRKKLNMSHSQIINSVMRFLKVITVYIRLDVVFGYTFFVFLWFIANDKTSDKSMHDIYYSGLPACNHVFSIQSVSCVYHTKWTTTNVNKQVSSRTLMPNILWLPISSRKILMCIASIVVSYSLAMLMQ